jgi:PAS domain S-box-containing protein
MPRLQRWPDLPLRTKALIVLAVPAVATLIVACASLVLVGRAAAEEEASARSARIVDETQRLAASEIESAAHMRAYFISTDEAYADRARAAFDAFDATLQKLSTLVAGNAGQTGRLTRVAALERSRVERVYGVAARFRSGELPWSELRVFLAAAETERLQMETILRDMRVEEARLLGERLRQVATLRAEVRATTTVCLLFGVIGGVVSSLLFASGIARRIGRLRENVVQLASGGVSLPSPGARDEIGALSEAVASTEGILRERAVAFENALQGIAEVDASGRYASFNEAYAELAGMGEGNRPVTVAATVRPEDRASVEAAIDLMRASGKAVVEARMVHPGGRAVDVAMTILPLSESNSGYYVFLRNISLRTEAQEEMVRARDAAVASNLARTGFLAKISHDIRTPLNAILGAADLLSETPLNADQSEYVAMFVRNCRRLVALINDFLDLSRIEAGALHMERVPLRVREAVDDAVATFREAASRKGIGLVVEMDAGLPEWVLGDALRIHQVLVNLLSNAVKFTAAGRVSVSVRKTWRSNGAAILYEVTDTGCGIDAADQTRIFAPFTQVPDQAAGMRGSGLGLAICREVVERMSGEIGVTSRKGSGSTFYFHTPLEAGQPADTPTDGDAGSSADPSRADPCARVEPARILVVEDTEDNRILLAHYLKGEPLEAVFAGSGFEALDLIRGNREFDLILMDIDLPGLDGYATTVLIREWEAQRGAPPTPIVALSAHAMAESVRASLDAGCAAHVAKPVDRATLLRAIRRYARPGRMASPSDAPALAEGVAELIPGYLASKPKQIEEARACLAAKDFAPIQRFGHNLCGTGPGYGFPRIEQLGREIEKAAAECDETRIARQLEALHRLVTEQGAALNAGQDGILRGG